MNIVNKIICLATVIALYGCDSLITVKKENNQIKDEIHSNSSFYPEQQAAIYVDSPDKYQEEVKLTRDPEWTRKQIAPINALGGIPFHSLLRQVLGNNNINYILSEEIDPNQLINVSINGTIKDALESISNVTGFTYSLNGTSVNWSPYVTETFNLSYIPGNYGYMVGSTQESGAGTGNGGGQGSGGSGDTQTVEFGSEGKEYSSVTANNDDVFSEIEKVSKQMIGHYGSVAASRSTSSIVVTTTRSRMELVRQYFKTVESKLGRQIAFEVRFLKFTSNKNSNAGIDWDYIKKTASRNLEFNGGDLTSIAGSSTPISFSATKNTGTESGTTALVSALEQIGKVSIVTSPRVVTQPNRVVELEQSDLQGYIARTDVTALGGGTIGVSQPSVALRQGVVKSGYRLYALANIGDQNKVILHISSTYIPKPKIERKEVQSSAIETPELSRNRLVSTTVLKSGSTMIISGLQVEANNDLSESPLSASYLPTRMSTSSTVTETIALVTPIIIDMNK